MSNTTTNNSRQVNPNPTFLEAIKQFAIRDWELGSTHGYPHWQRVERNGLLLATAEVNLTVVRLFAYLHDKCREDEMGSTMLPIRRNFRSRSSGQVIPPLAAKALPDR